MSGQLTLQLVLLCGLWPFSGGDSDSSRDDVATVGDLESQPFVMPAAQPVEADQQAALEQYRRFLELPAADQGLQREALRRLGDLSLSVGELESIENPRYAGDNMVFHADAIAVYERWLAGHGDKPGADLVLYQLARAYDSAAQPEEALARLEQLTAGFPHSEFIHEARFRQAEILFSQQNFNAAAPVFARVVAAGEHSAFFEQALYKYGWTRFKLGEYDASTPAFLDLLQRRLGTVSQTSGLDSSADMLATLSRPERELIEDTLRALSLTFSSLDGPASLAAWLDARSGDPALLLYRSLAQLYREQERYLDAAASYAAFSAREPLHPLAPTMADQRIEAYRDGRFPSQVLTAKQDFVRAYGLDSTYWSAHNPSARTDVLIQLKAHLSDLATHDHALAQDTGLAADYSRAAGWYRRYLDYFPADPESAGRSFLLGEILTESKDFAGATEFYERAAYNYPGYERAAEAGYAGLLAARSRLEELDGTARQEWQRQQLQRGLHFATAFPAHPQSPAVLADTAERYFSARDFEPAVRVAGRLLQDGSGADNAQRKVAWTVVAHAHFDLGHFARAERAYGELRMLGGSAALQGVELDERIAAAIYRQAEASEAAGKTDAAVQTYLRVATAAPAASGGANAVYDAASLLLREEQWEQAIVVLAAFRNNYPGHHFSDEVTTRLALAQERAGHVIAAAGEYRQVANLESVTAEVRQEALWKAAELYEQEGDSSRARAAWRDYVQSHPEPLTEAIEVQQRLADLAGAAGDGVDRNTWLKNVVASDARAAGQRTDRTRTLAARATLELAEPQRLAFAAVRLKAPLADSLKLKRTRMEAALKAYDTAAGYGVAEVTTVATYRIAELYYQLSADLLDSERPAGLDADALEQYELLLEEQAYPFEERAIELFTVNTARAADGVYDEWVARSYARLAILMPARYAKAEKAESHVTSMY